MKLNHVNLAVTDVAATDAFLQRYFGFTTMGSHHNMAFLQDDDGAVISLTGIRSEVKYPVGFHVGFVKTTNERVDEINQRLLDDGFEVKPPARPHGAWTFYFQAPGGFTIEVLSLSGA